MWKMHTLHTTTLQKLSEKELAAEQEAIKQRSAEGTSAWNHAGAHGADF
jgi:hypothetical protein